MDRTIYCDADSLWLTDAATLWAEFDAMEDSVLFGMAIENEEPDGRCLWYSEGARGAETGRRTLCFESPCPGMVYKRTGQQYDARLSPIKRD